MESQLVHFDGTLVVVVFSFLVFWLSMNQVFFKPLLSIREERQAYIQSNQKQTEDMTAEANIILNDYEFKIQRARQDAHELVDDSLSKAKLAKNHIIHEAIAKAKLEVDMADTTLIKEKNQLLQSLNTDVEQLSIVINEKILGHEFPVYSQNRSGT